MTEVHCPPYSVHPGGQKVYKDLKKTFSWPNMKKDVAEFMAKCLTCQRVNVSNANHKIRFSHLRCHSENDGQTERTIKALEYMSRSCAMEFGGSWEDRMDLIEFSYNTSYHTSIGITPFEAFYGRKCRSPISWDDSAEIVVLGLEMV
ncbi:uncharacterized protein LOC141613849 [Silene latifolia]|uniref:uncharacterized protein LOC141613849 n=1 Tax=Silene latifolia TaxID=37657 RepID=UPI003D77D0D8